MNSLKPCPNPECDSSKEERLPKYALQRKFRGRAVCVKCYFCELQGPEGFAPENSDDQNWAEAVRLWNALPRQSDLAKLWSMTSAEAAESPKHVIAVGGSSEETRLKVQASKDGSATHAAIPPTDTNPKHR